MLQSNFDSLPLFILQMPSMTADDRSNTYICHSWSFCSTPRTIVTDTKIPMAAFDDQSYPGPQFNIKMTSYQYRKSHCGNKTILRPSYLHNGISYADKMTSLYWFRTQIWIILEITLYVKTSKNHADGLRVVHVYGFKIVFILITFNVKIEFDLLFFLYFIFGGSYCSS